MRMPTASLAAAGLPLLAFTAFAVNALMASGSAATPSPAARDASRQQVGAAPPPGTRCSSEKGGRCPRPSERNNAPQVQLRASEQKITLGCPEGETSQTCTPSASPQVQLQANATDPDGDTLLYSYSATGGRVTGDGADVTWDLTGLRRGTYTANVEVYDCCGCVAFSSVQVRVEVCSDCGANLK